MVARRKRSRAASLGNEIAGILVGLAAFQDRGAVAAEQWVGRNSGTESAVSLQ